MIKKAPGARLAGYTMSILLLCSYPAAVGRIKLALPSFFKYTTNNLAMKSVWLLKSDDESNRNYSEVLLQHGFKSSNIPALEFKFINESALKNALEKPQDFSGLIFTSLRAVDAVKNLYINLPVQVHNEWTKNKVFAIGHATAAAVQESLNLNPLGGRSGNSKQLAQIIIEETKPFDKPLLFPCGSLKKDDLPNLLVNHDRDFRAMTCYETKQNPQLKSSLQKLSSSNSRPDFIVFFSPSGVNFALPVLNDLKFDLTGINVIAIGPTTNAALVSSDVPVYGICQEPTPSGIAQLLSNYNGK